MKRRAILVFDNDYENAENNKRRLSDVGFNVAVYPFDIKNHEYLEEYKPDLVVMDISFYDNFKDWVRYYRIKRGKTSIPVLIIANSLIEVDKLINCEQCVFDFIIKPASASLLIAHAKALIARMEAYEKEYAARINSLKHNISGALPHEFRTSLTGILGFSKIIQDITRNNSNLGEEYINDIRDMAGAILSSGNHLFRLTENFLLYSQLQAHAADTERKAIEMGVISSALEAISEAVSSIKIKCEGEYRIDLDIEDAALKIGYYHFNKLIYELLDNAAKFSKPGSRISIVAFRDMERYFIQISDQGRGMKREEIESIGAYNQFERSVYEQQGAGLGLAIAQLISKLYNGTFVMESEKGKGSTVRITLPIMESGELENAYFETNVNSNGKS